MILQVVLILLKSIPSVVRCFSQCSQKNSRLSDTLRFVSRHIFPQSLQTVRHSESLLASSISSFPVIGV